MPHVVPSIAQLVERRTVEVTLSSLGRWFESGSKDNFFFSRQIDTSFPSIAFYFSSQKPQQVFEATFSHPGAMRPCEDEISVDRIFAETCFRGGRQAVLVNKRELMLLSGSLEAV